MIQTERLKLRQWIATDKKPFSELNTDLDVMEYFPNTLNKLESDSLAESLKARILENGWGFWAVELKDSNAFIGFVGLNSPAIKLPFSPCVEIGWRLSKKYWSNGYATEAAIAGLRFAFENLSLNEVVSFTSTQNKQSQAVMKRIHMTDTEQNFLHPSVAVNSDLQEHVLFKITKTEWKGSISKNY